MDEDRIKDRMDYIMTHDNPHSPYYDGPDEDETEEELEEEEGEDDED